MAEVWDAVGRCSIADVVFTFLAQGIFLPRKNSELFALSTVIYLLDICRPRLKLSKPIPRRNAR